MPEWLKFCTFCKFCYIAMIFCKYFLHYFENRCSHAAQKMKFSIKDFFGKCDQTRRKLRIRSYLLKKSLMENFTFCAVSRSWRSMFAKSMQRINCISQLNGRMKAYYCTKNGFSYRYFTRTLPTNIRKIFETNSNFHVK